MRLKHNKKRNTAFLYETLIKELTKCIVSKDTQKKDFIISVIKENFNKNSILGKELELYKTINEIRGLDIYTAERMLLETVKRYKGLNKKEIYENQSMLIRLMNGQMSSSIFSNFVPNYRSLATISQIFNNELPPKEKVLLEKNLIISMTSKRNQILENKMPHIDMLTYKKFVESFNKKYGKSLLPEQRDILKHYITSFSDNGLLLKMYLNEEVGRLKGEVSRLVNSPLVSGDKVMIEKCKKVHEKLNALKNKALDSKTIEEVMKVQGLVAEVVANDGTS